MRSLPPALVFLSLVTLISSQADQHCPQIVKIEPCTCEEYEFLNYPLTLILTCQGPNITQESIATLFEEVRFRNNVGTLVLVTESFSLFNTTLTSFDLYPLHQLQVQDIFIQDNPLLTTIPVTELFYLFTWELYLPNNGLVDSSVAELLKILNKQFLYNMDLSGNQLTGSPGTEFLPHISEFQDLAYVNLSNNAVKNLTGGEFRKMSSLLILDLSNNQLGEGEVGKDAFLFDQLSTEYPTLELEIYLDGNNLKDENFHEENGLESTFQKTSYLYMRNNKFEFLSENKFRKFMYAQAHNRIYMEGNQIVCDERNQWIRDAAFDLQYRMMGLDCVNDPGYNIFTTSLLA